MTFPKIVTAPFLLSCCLILAAQNPAHRPPAVPLAVNDPSFSLWSTADRLTDAPTEHWTGTPQPMTGLAAIDGQVFHWVGTDPSGELAQIPAMHQESLAVTALHTRYILSAGGIRLTVAFFTAAFPADLDILSRPVTYLTWSAQSTDSRAHSVSLLLDVSPLIVVNDASQPVIWGRFAAPGLSVLRVGTRD